MAGQRNINQGHKGTYPTRGTNGGINSTKFQKAERSSPAAEKVRTVTRAGQGGKGDISPMTGPKTNKSVSG